MGTLYRRVAPRVANRSARRGPADASGSQPAVGQSDPLSWGIMMPYDPPDLTIAGASPLLVNPEWIRSFTGNVNSLLDAPRSANQAAASPIYQAFLIDRGWRPFLPRSDHLRKAVLAGRERASTWVHLIDRRAIDQNVYRADQLAWAALNEVADPAGPNEAMMTALEGIARLSALSGPSHRLNGRRFTNPRHLRGLRFAPRVDGGPGRRRSARDGPSSRNNSDGSPYVWPGRLEDQVPVARRPCCPRRGPPPTLARRAASRSASEPCAGTPESTTIIWPGTIPRPSVSSSNWPNRTGHQLA